MRSQYSAAYHTLCLHSILFCICTVHRPLEALFEQRSAWLAPWTNNFHYNWLWIVCASGMDASGICLWKRLVCTAACMYITAVCVHSCLCAADRMCNCLYVQLNVCTTAFKGTVSRDFLLLVFFMNQFPQGPEYTIRAVSNFFENSRRYSQLKVGHRYQRHRWQICHQC